MKIKLSTILMVAPAIFLIGIIAEQLFNSISINTYNTIGEYIGYRNLINIILIFILGAVALFGWFLSVKKQLDKPVEVIKVEKVPEHSAPLGYMRTDSNNDTSETKFHTFNDITFKYEPSTGDVYNTPYCPVDKIPLTDRRTGYSSRYNDDRIYTCGVCGYTFTKSEREVQNQKEVFKNLLVAFNNKHIKELPTKSKK